MKLYRLIWMAAVATACCSPAFCDTFDFSFSGGAYSPYPDPIIPGPQHQGNGQFSTTQTAAGQYQITGVSGETDGVAITSLLPGGTFAGNDNVLIEDGSLDAPRFTIAGVSYALVDGGLVNLYFGAETSNGVLLGYLPEIYLQTTPEPTESEFLETLTITPAAAQAPEPGTMSLVGLGLMGAVGAVRRRYR